MPVTDDNPEATDTDERGERLPATPFLRFETIGADACIRPKNHPMDGEIHLYTTRDNRISVGVDAKDSDVEVNAGFYLSPEDAERLAEYLEVFAAKAREGTEWIHP